MIPNTHHRWVDLAAWVLHCPCLFGSVMYQARSRIYHIPGDFIIFFLKKKILYFVKKKNYYLSAGVGRRKRWGEKKDEKKW